MSFFLKYYLGFRYIYVKKKLIIPTNLNKDITFIIMNVFLIPFLSFQKFPYKLLSEYRIYFTRESNSVKVFIFSDKYWKNQKQEKRCIILNLN